MAIEIVSFPMKNGDFPLFFVCLPEGKPPNIHWMPPVVLRVPSQNPLRRDFSGIPDRAMSRSSPSYRPSPAKNGVIYPKKWHGEMGI